MRIEVVDAEPGEVRAKLAAIVEHLLGLDDEPELLQKAGHAHDETDGDGDPREADFQHATTLAMYRRAKSAFAARLGVLQRQIDEILG